MVCYYCGRNIEAIGQDNVSPYPNIPLCEDCGEDDDIMLEARLAYEEEQSRWQSTLGI